jgi:hypothetical protein
MRFRAILVLVSLFILTVFVACLSVAVSSDAIASQPSLFKDATEHGSVSGKISSIGDASFSVDVNNSQKPVTLQFLVDDSTKVEGRLEVGAVATVDYRTDAGNNIALHVVVRPPSKPQ